MTKMCETKIAPNNSTTVPSPFRTAEDAKPGDKLEWHHEDDEWILRKATGEDE